MIRDYILSKYSGSTCKGRTIKKVMGGGGGGEFFSRRNFFPLSNSLYEFLGRSMNIF